MLAKERRGRTRTSMGFRRHLDAIRKFSASLAASRRLLLTRTVSCRIISQITRSLDLNDLDAISRTCRQFRANLLQFRRQLVKQSLRCRNEEASSIAGAEARITDSERGWHILGDGGLEPSRMTSGKIGACARDMVADCRRCGRVVCRVRNKT